MSDVAVTEGDRPPGPAEWAQLTSSPDKRASFTEDLYFRECWRDAVDVLGGSTATVLQSVALLLVKPDGVIARRLGSIIDFVRSQGFVPVTGVPVRFTRHSMRELWRHDWHVYPTDRLALATFMYTSAEALLVLLLDARPDGPMPASARLSSLKGAAEPSGRRPGQLRTLLRPPNPVVNFVHVADEPVDVVRELGIMLDRPERRTALAALRPGSARAGIDLGEEIDRLHRGQPEHDLDVARALDRMESSGALAAPAASRLREHVRRGSTLSWAELCALADPYAGDIDIWDFICVSSVVLPRTREVRPAAVVAPD